MAIIPYYRPDISRCARLVDCTSFVGGDTVVMRITVSAQSNANAYVENLTFRYQNN
ncbi:MAG: hypothetical protein WAU03_01120 [Candidatus Saccharimonas aalborgensis]